MEFTHKVAWKFLKWGISHELLIRKHKGTFESLLPCHEFWSQGGLEVKSRTPLKSVSVIFVMETTYADSWSDWFSLVTLGGHEVKVSMTDILRFSDSWRLWCMNIIVWDNETVCLIWPQSKCRSLWPIFHGPVILPYSAGEEKSPLFIFLHDQLPLFLGETGRNSGKFLQVSPGNPIFSPGNTCISPWNFRTLLIKLHVFSEKLCYFSLKFLWEIWCFSLKF